MSKRSQGPLGATDSGLSLSDYPLGSPLSRAAARAVLSTRKAAQGEGTLVRVCLIGRAKELGRECICPTPEAGAFAVFRCFL
jgi:hypothetical protein